MSLRLDDSPGEVVIGQYRFMCSPFRPGRHLMEIKRHLLANRPSPLSLLTAEIEKIPEACQKEMLSKAYEDTLNRRQPTDIEAFAFLDSFEGMVLIVWICARDYNPAVTKKQIDAAVDSMNESGEEVKSFVDSITLGIYRMDPTRPAPSRQAARRKNAKKSTGKSSRMSSSLLRKAT